MLLEMPMPADLCLKISCSRSSESDLNEASELVRLMFGLAITPRACHSTLMSKVEGVAI